MLPPVSLLLAVKACQDPQMPGSPIPSHAYGDPVSGPSLFLAGDGPHPLNHASLPGDRLDRETQPEGKA